MAIRYTVPAEEAVEYVPDIDDNRERAEAGEVAMVVTLMPIDGADHDKLHSSMMGGRSMSDANLYKRAKKFIRRMVEKYVIEVSGYELCGRDGDVLMTPKNGAELYKAIMLSPPEAGDIIDDIVKALKSETALSDGELGNLRRRSGSSQPTTRPSETGLVSDVKGSTGIPTAPSPHSASSASGSDSASGSGDPATVTTFQTPTSKGRLRGIAG